MYDYGYVKVGAISPRVALASPGKNAQAILEAIAMAENAGVQAMVFPELCLSGCTCADLFGQAALLEACEEALGQLLSGTKDSAALVAVGLPLRARGRLFNCAAVLQGGRLLGVVPKRCLSAERGESRWFSPGASVPEGAAVTLCAQEVPFGQLLFDLGSVRVGVELGEDLWSPEPPSTALALQGTELILCLSAVGEAAGRGEYQRALVAQQSGRLHCGYALAGAGAGESSTDLVFSGACCVAENGGILTESRRFEQDGSALYHCVDAELLRAERRAGIYAQAVAQAQPIRSIACAPLPPLEALHITRRYSAHPFIPEGVVPQSKRCREILQMQAAALVRRLEHTTQQQIILGLSGGLDSALALLVACRAAQALEWKPEQVLCISMPGFGTTAYTRETAELLAESLGVTLWEIDLRPACELHMQDIGHDPNEHDATYENIQARERTQILMDLANQENALLIGTGSLSELALGWCTYNGDHMSMYAVNAGVPKTLARRLVAYVMDESGEMTAAALRRVLESPVSPELLPLDAAGESPQQTEAVLGKYEVHDFYLYYFLRYGFAPEKLFFMAKQAFDGRYAPAQLTAWLRVFFERFFSQQFKRSCLPDGPRVGSVTLSPRGGWQMPSDAAAALWLKRVDALENSLPHSEQRE